MSVPADYDAASMANCIQGKCHALGVKLTDVEVKTMTTLLVQLPLSVPLVISVTKRLCCHLITAFGSGKTKDIFEAFRESVVALQDRTNMLDHQMVSNPLLLVCLARRWSITLNTWSTQ